MKGPTKPPTVAMLLMKASPPAAATPVRKRVGMLQKIARAAMEAFDADGITIQQFSEPAGGQVVFHLHMHVMPRHEGVVLLPPASRKEDGKVLEANAAKLMAALK